MTLLTSIVAGNSAAADQGQDVSGGFNSLGHNLIGDTDGSSGWVGTDLLNVDPMLGPLQDNGGPTMTMALLPGSPAIDAGVPVAGITTDQRGISRTAYGPPDIGAFEAFQTGPLVLATPVINDGAAQRSNVTTIALTFNQLTNIQALIDDHSIGSAVQLFGEQPDPSGGRPVQLQHRQLHPDHRPEAHRQAEDHAGGRPL